MKKIIPALLTIIAIVFSTSLFAQWVNKQSFAGSARTFAMGFSINDTAYILGGSDANGTTFRDMWAYEPGTNIWTQKANIAGGFRAAAASFTIGSKAYVGTGVDGVGYLDDFFEYDSNTNSWLPKAIFPGGPREEAVGFSIGNKGYMGTGQIFVVGPNTSFTNAFKDFYEYDPASDTWLQKADVPGPERAYAVGTSFGNKGYVGLGGNDDQSASFSDFYEYDPVTDTWTAKASMIGSGRADAGILSTSNDIYIIGGINFPSFAGTSGCQKYDPAVDTWSNAPLFGGGVIIAPVVVNVNGKGYAGTGYNSSLVIRKDWWEFTPANTTGLYEHESESLKIFPNPSADFITIDCKDCFAGFNTTIEIIDETGKIVLKQTFPSNNNIKMDVTTIAEGHYVIRVLIENKLVRQIRIIR